MGVLQEKVLLPQIQKEPVSPMLEIDGSPTRANLKIMGKTNSFNLKVNRMDLKAMLSPRRNFDKTLMQQKISELQNRSVYPVIPQNYGEIDWKDAQLMPPIANPNLFAQRRVRAHTFNTGDDPANVDMMSPHLSPAR